MLVLLGAVIGELVAYDGAGVGDKGSNDILFEAKGEIEIGPCFVAVLEDRHAEDEVVDVFYVALTSPLVAKTENNARDFNVGEGHVVGGSREHLGEIIGGFFFVCGGGLGIGAVEGEPLVLLWLTIHG